LCEDFFKNKKKTILNLLWAPKNTHVGSALQGHLEQEMTVCHWPTIVIGSGGESYIVSHFVQSIFSGSWVGMWEKLNSVRWMLNIERWLLLMKNAHTIFSQHNISFVLGHSQPVGT
jgi:hypothetical protein